MLKQRRREFEEPENGLWRKEGERKEGGEEGKEEAKRIMDEP